MNNNYEDITISSGDPEYKIMGLEEELNSLLHACVKCAIRNSDLRLMNYVNLNYNNFIKDNYPSHHRSIREITREE